MTELTKNDLHDKMMVLIGTDGKARLSKLPKDVEYDHTTLFVMEPEYKLGMFVTVQKVIGEDPVYNSLANKLFKKLRTSTTQETKERLSGDVYLYDDYKDMSIKTWNMIRKFVKAVPDSWYAENKVKVDHNLGILRGNKKGEEKEFVSWDEFIK